MHFCRTGYEGRRFMQPQGFAALRSGSHNASCQSVRVASGAITTAPMIPRTALTRRTNSTSDTLYKLPEWISA